MVLPGGEQLSIGVEIPLQSAFLVGFALHRPSQRDDRLLHVLPICGSISVTVVLAIGRIVEHHVFSIARLTLVGEIELLGLFPCLGNVLVLDGVIRLWIAP